MFTSSTRDSVSHRDDLGDALVTDLERREERRPAGDDRAIEIAGCRRDGANDGLERAGDARVRALLPLESLRTGVDERLHEEPLGESIAGTPRLGMVSTATSLVS